MTWNELIQYVTDKLARPNETYITYVLPNLIKQCISQIETYWDWNHQYYELVVEVKQGEKEIVFDVANARLKKIVGNYVYDLDNERMIEYKKFLPSMITEIQKPAWFTVTPHGQIILSGLVPEDTIYTVPTRIIRTNFTTHTLLTLYPYLLADYVIAHAQKDFDKESGLKELQLQTSILQKYNLEEKDMTPPITRFNYGIRRNMAFGGSSGVQS